MSYTTSAKVYLRCGLTSADIDSDIVTQFITWSDGFIDSKTNKNYSSATSYTEINDIIASPYNKDVFVEGGASVGVKPLEAYDRIMLLMKPVNSISNVFLLVNDLEINKLYSYGSSAF